MSRMVLPNIRIFSDMGHVPGGWPDSLAPGDLNGSASLAIGVRDFVVRNDDAKAQPRGRRCRGRCCDKIATDA